MNNLLVSGYRAHELNIFNQKHEGIAYIKQAITNKLLPLIDDGLQWVITPGQYGVDLWACEAVIALKPQYPQLRLSIITAYSNPEEKWKDDKKEYYEQVLKGVDYYASVSDKPYDGIWQLQARDELLFRKTDGILLVYDEDAGKAVRATLRSVRFAGSRPTVIATSASARMISRALLMRRIIGIWTSTIRLPVLRAVFDIRRRMQKWKIRMIKSSKGSIRKMDGRSI